MSRYQKTYTTSFPKINSVNSGYSTAKEFKSVIKSMKSNSSPGPSSKPRNLYKLLFDIFPNICILRTFGVRILLLKIHMNIESRPLLFLYLSKTFLLSLHISFYFARYPLNWFLVGEHLSSC